MHEPLPLSKIQEAVLEFLQGRDDAMLLTRFPELKAADGEVGHLLIERGASVFAIEFWNDLVKQDFVVDDEGSDLSF